MIDKFKVFELRYETYMKAAEKAEELGHIRRKTRLTDWAKIAGTSKSTKNPPKSLGIFNFNADIFINDKRYTPPKLILDSPNINLGEGWRVEKQGPIKSYLSMINVDGSIYIEKEEFDNISILANFVYVDDNDKVISVASDLSGDIDVPFIIMVPIKWEEGVFSIDDEKVSIGSFWRGHDVVFSDRKSAVKFKNILVNLKQYYPKEYESLREFFMENSTADDFELFWGKLKELNVNKLYRD
jgi:hypothetical protein